MSPRFSRLGHLVHSAQAACADIDVAQHPIDWQATVLDIDHKAPVGMTFRVAYIASILRFAPADIAASGHTLPTPFTFIAVFLYDAR